MQTFSKYVEVWDEEDFKRRYQFGELKLDLSDLPSNVMVNSTLSIKDLPPFSVTVEFYRRKSPYPEYTNILIPFGKNQKMDYQEAISLAKKIVEKNTNRYTKVNIFRKTKYVGKGIFSDESDREYF